MDFESRNFRSRELEVLRKYDDEMFEGKWAMKVILLASLIRGRSRMQVPSLSVEYFCHPVELPFGNCSGNVTKIFLASFYLLFCALNCMIFLSIYSSIDK